MTGNGGGLPDGGGGVAGFHFFRCLLFSKFSMVVVVLFVVKDMELEPAAGVFVYWQHGSTMCPDGASSH